MSRGQHEELAGCHPLGGMVRRVVGVAVGLVVIVALGLAPGDRDETAPSYSSTQALAGDIYAHGIGCSRVYPIDLQISADHDAALCEVGSATVTLHVWKGVARPTNLGRRRVTPRRWLVPTGWWRRRINSPQPQVAAVIGGDLIPS